MRVLARVCSFCLGLRVCGLRCLCLGKAVYFAGWWKLVWGRFDVWGVVLVCVCIFWFGWVTEM